MHPTRQQILDYLERHQRATAAELGRALKVTPANVRHHLRILMEDGWVDQVEPRPPRGRGRPTRVYALTTARQPDNLSGLVGALLGRIPPQERASAFASLAEALSAHTPPLPAERHLTQHLIHTVRCLNAMHYRARWEAHAAAPRIRLNHCPYTAILEQHPELCELDAHLLSRHLHRRVRQLAKRENSPSGGPFCLFEIV